ncbi:hypothetical protein [Bradyrhizobium canariense]|uniref:hypothetical protein n=1 Tax=Bradyrhizobium canariense TaxID=255045 RepID=UPI001CA57748|nr:hypothetical protein [Bradyrhizobium canariense]
MTKQSSGDLRREDAKLRGLLSPMLTGTPSDPLKDRPGLIRRMRVMVFTGDRSG